MSAVARAKKVRRRVREGATEPAWISREVIVAVHTALLRDHGGSPGIRDEFHGIRAGHDLDPPQLAGGQ